MILKSGSGESDHFNDLKSRPTDISTAARSTLRGAHTSAARWTLGVDDDVELSVTHTASLPCSPFTSEGLREYQRLSSLIALATLSREKFRRHRIGPAAQWVRVLSVFGIWAPVVYAPQSAQIVPLIYLKAAKELVLTAPRATRRL